MLLKTYTESLQNSYGILMKKRRYKHWVSWDSIRLLKEGGGLCFRSLFDVSKALFAKLWWSFRTKKSMWANFVWSKYCKRHRPHVVEWNGGSQVWKFMLEARNQVDQEILWEPRYGNSSIWFDNWTKLGALHYYLPIGVDNHYHLEEVKSLMTQGVWNKELLEAWNT